MRKIKESEASRILKAVTFDKAFHFYTENGSYTGLTATSLADFLEKLQKVSNESILFHFQRGDFQKWIKDILGDVELAGGISKIPSSSYPEELRKQLRKVTRKRLLELSRLSKHSLAGFFVDE